MICSRKEFCKLAGCSAANLSTYIGRDKVVLENDKKHIDTQHRVNKEFLLRRRDMGKGMVSAEPEPEPPNPEPPAHQSKKLTKAEESAKISKYNLELEKLQAELDKKLVDTELARQKLSVLLGNNVPIDLVKNIITQFSKAIINNYKAFGEQQITEICHQHRINDEDRAKLIAKNTTGLNNTHKKAVNDARTQMKNAVGSTKMKELEKPDADDN